MIFVSCAGLGKTIREALMEYLPTLNSVMIELQRRAKKNHKVGGLEKKTSESESTPP